MKQAFGAERVKLKMYLQHQYRPGRRWLARLPYGADLLEALEKFAAEQNIRAGQVQLIGAVSRAALGFYDQRHQEYWTSYHEEALEILHCTGNISIRDGKPMAHLHITLANRSRAALGGHLMPGTIVFAAEAAIEELLGPETVRGHDLQTGLYLWEK